MENEYIIPANYTDAGKLLGAFEIRSAAEAVLLCVPLAACEWGSETGGSENGGSENGGNSGDPSAVRTTVTEEEWNAAVYGDAIYFFVYGQSAVFLMILR